MAGGVRRRLLLPVFVASLRCPLGSEVLLRAVIRVAVQVALVITGNAGDGVREELALRVVRVLPQPVRLPTCLHDGRWRGVVRKPEPVTAEERIPLLSEAVFDDVAAVQHRLAAEALGVEVGNSPRLV